MYLVDSANQTNVFGLTIRFNLYITFDGLFSLPEKKKSAILGISQRDDVNYFSLSTMMSVLRTLNSRRNFRH